MNVPVDRISSTAAVGPGKCVRTLEKHQPYSRVEVLFGLIGVYDHSRGRFFDERYEFFVESFLHKTWFVFTKKENRKSGTTLT